MSTDTLRYEIRSPYAIYWLGDAGTVWGPSAPAWQLESHLWRGTATNPEVVIWADALDMIRATNVDSFSVQSDGRVVLKNGAPPAVDTWTDVFPRLPEDAVRTGLTWRDSLVNGDTTVRGGRYYRRVQRSVINRIVDTLGTRLLEITSQGRVHVRLTVDSTAWIGVTGPIIEHVVFDLTKGRLIRRASSMILSGVGVATATVDTVPALFQSSTIMELAEPARGRLLLERLAARRPGS